MNIVLISRTPEKLEDVSTEISMLLLFNPLTHPAGLICPIRELSIFFIYDTFSQKTLTMFDFYRDVLAVQKSEEKIRASNNVQVALYLKLFFFSNVHQISLF